MIRRCEHIGRDGYRCRYREGHRSTHGYDSSATWCPCGDYRPAHGWQFCGACGGKHAHESQGSPALSLVPQNAQQRDKARRRALIRSRHLAMQEGQ